MIPSADNANRMALGIVEKEGIPYEEAEKRLWSLGLSVQCDERLRTSAALQAALLTVVNCGERCFLGGVAVELPESVELLIPWPAQTLNEAVAELLQDISQPGIVSERVVIGGCADDSWSVFATGWKAVVAFGPDAAGLSAFDGQDHALGGIFGGAMVVHHAFARATTIEPAIDWQTDGLSLWRPGHHWASAPDGPPLAYLPNGIWYLGLGHLGQAFIWALGLLPLANPADCEIMLQDTDVVTKANYGTGLLTRLDDIGAQKTRMVENWLRSRRFKTKICDRYFDEHTFRSDREPAVAFCGFHDGESRRLIGNAGFELVVEAGLGSQIADFDQVLLHTFPNGQFKSEDTWREDPVTTMRTGLFEKLGGKAVCGAIELAGKAVSTSFVGAAAAALAWAEVLRQYHKGQSFNQQSVSMRTPSEAKFSEELQVSPSSLIAIRGYIFAKR